MYFTYHTGHSFKVYDSVAFSIFTVQPSPLIPEYRHCPQNQPQFHQHSLSFPSQLCSHSHLSPGTMNLLSVSMDDSPILDISHEWTHIIVWDWPLSLSSQGSPKRCILFFCWIILPMWTYHPMFSHSSLNGHLGCIHFFAVVNYCWSTYLCPSFLWNSQMMW